MRFIDISRNVLIDLRKVMERVDNFSEKHEASLISQERKYRKEFEKAVRKTKPGFHGEKDTNLPSGCKLIFVYMCTYMVVYHIL